MNDLKALEKICNASRYFGALAQYTCCSRNYIEADNYEWEKYCIDVVKALTIIRLVDEGKIVQCGVVIDNEGNSFKEFRDIAGTYKYLALKESSCLCEKKSIEEFCLPSEYRIYLPHYKFLREMLMGDLQKVFRLLTGNEGRYSYSSEKRIKEVLYYVYTQKQFECRLTWTWTDSWNLTLILCSHGLYVGQINLRMSGEMVKENVKAVGKYTKVYNYLFVNDRTSVLC